MTTLTREEMLAKAQKMVEIAAHMMKGQRWCPNCEMISLGKDDRCFCDYDSPMMFISEDD